MSPEPVSPPARSGVGAAPAALIGVIIGALMGSMVALPIANNARLHLAYPRAVMNLMEHDYDQLFDRAAGGQCDATADKQLQRLRSLAADVPAAFKSEADAEFVAANDALIEALDKAAAQDNCAGLVEALDQVDRQCESCHSDFR